MYLIRNIFFMGSLLLPVFLQAQEEDTNRLQVNQLKEVMIWGPQIQVIYPQIIDAYLGKKQIELLNPDDIGELAGKLPGTSTRSYGGLGGLKSISVRGLGGQHSAIVLDGFNLTNAQSGQINLGQIQSDGIEQVLLIHIPASSSLTQVSAQFAGSQLELNSFLDEIRNNERQVKATIRYGSFKRKEVYVSGKLGKERWNCGGFGKFRQADGDYNFNYLNGNQQVNGIRQNNDYLDFNIGGKIGYNFKNDSRWQLQYRATRVDQGLAGAVILYNETADERMVTDDHRVLTDYYFTRGFNKARVYGSFGINRLNYNDPTYLNSQGFLDETYTNNNVNLGYIEVSNSLNWTYKWGFEQAIDWMPSSGTNLGTPFRSSSYLLAGFNKLHRYLVFESQLGLQYVYDENAHTEVNSHLQFTPTIRVRRSDKKRFQWLTWYKRTFRMPSFNELYFGSVGNHNLQPEIAHQSNIGYRWLPLKWGGKMYITIGQDAFFNEVQNKIVAIPTKNLFIWSMQNVENARVYGTNVNASFTKQIKKFLFTLNANYTWQRVLDVTQNSITYGHQIAYAPEHLANADLVTAYKDFSFVIANNFVSGRYALNQNVKGNYLDPYWTTDLSLKYQHELKNKHAISAQINVKNIWNTSYAFIRSYIMPGRHFLISLSYEIH